MVEGGHLRYSALATAVVWRGILTTAMRHKAAPRTGVDWFLLVLKVALFSVIGFGLFAFVLQQLDPNNWLAQRINDDATGLTADQFEGLVISGLSQGAMYGLIALGYSMVYGVLGFINFAHGEVFMVGAMTGMITSNKLFEAGAWESNFVASLLFIVLVAIIVSTLTAVVMERVAYRPLRGSPRLIPLITSIGISFFIQNVSVVLLGPGAKSYPDLPDWWTETQTIWFVEVQRTRLWLCSLPQWRWRRCGISSNAPRPARRCEQWPRTRRSPRSWASMSTGSLSRRSPSVARWLVWPGSCGASCSDRSSTRPASSPASRPSLLLLSVVSAISVVRWLVASRSVPPSLWRHC